MQHILITGGTGLIGTALINKLLGQQHKITVISRDPEKAKINLPKGIESIIRISDLTNLDDYDAVINLAGEPIVDKRWSDNQMRVIEQSRWQITSDIVSLMQRSDKPPKVFISGSAIGYYGRQGAEPINESFDQPHAEFSHYLCKQWESIAMQGQSDNTRVCILRTGIVLAANGGAVSKMLLPFKLGLGGPIGDGSHYMSWIHIDDMVDAILFLLNQNTSQGVYNLTAPNPVTNREFSKALAGAVNRPCLLFTPQIALKLALGESADLLIYGQNVVPKRLLDEGFRFFYEDINDALNSLSL